MDKESTIFKPSEELIAFANEFSGNYRKLSVGTYSSDDGQFRIDYLDKIRDNVTGSVINTPANIGHDSKVMQLGKNYLMDWNENSDFIFWLIIWLMAKVTNKKCTENDTYTDIFVLGYYVTTGRSLKNMALGFLDLSKNTKNMEHNIKRYKAIDNFIKEFQKNEQDAN